MYVPVPVPVCVHRQEEVLWARKRKSRPGRLGPGSERYQIKAGIHCFAWNPGLS